MSFIQLGLSEKTIKALGEIGFEEPTTVQSDVIPAILGGKDIFTIAPNCCGKTISYILPLVDIINKKEAKSILIITSDSKKSVEISDYLAILNKFHEEDTPNESYDNESDVIIGSPDLLMELVNEEQVDLSKTNILVVDDINLIKSNKQIENMEKVLEMLPTDKQNIVYTNRRSKETQIILDKILKTPQEVKVDKSHIIESPQRIDTDKFLALSQNPNIEKNQILVPRSVKIDKNQILKKPRKQKIAKEQVVDSSEEATDENTAEQVVAPSTTQKTTDKAKKNSKKKTETETGCKGTNTDAEALRLVEKYNSFNGRPPKFILCKVNLADSE